jgi:hypothetical protein
MASILGQKLEDYVENQIAIRQQAHGSGTNSSRYTDQINVLNANTSWIKLASGVSVSKSRLEDAGLSDFSSGKDLAQKNVLFAGTGKFNSSNDKLIQRSGNESYEFSEKGWIPMAGITNLSVKSLNRGALKKATVNITAYSKRQFEIINILYMHLGYTVMLEWGNAYYLSNKFGDRTSVLNTFIEDKFFSKNSQGSYLDILGPIESYRRTYQGNYDGMLAKITNYSWSFKKDGTYEIELNLVSMGDVVESLKSNISIDSKLSGFLETFKKNQETTGAPPVIEANKDADLLSSYLFLYQYFDNELVKTGVTSSVGNEITVEVNPSSTTNPKGVNIGYFLSNGNATITTTQKKYRYVTFPEGLFDPKVEDEITFTAIDPKLDATSELFRRYQNASSSPIKNQVTQDQIKTFGNYTYYIDPESSISEGSVLIYGMEEIPLATPASITTTVNPIDNDPPKVAFKLNATNPQYYIKMGYILEFLKNKLIPAINTGGTNPPLVGVSTELESNIMFCLAPSVSLDPKVCIVRNDGFRIVSGTPVGCYTQLEKWIDTSNGNKAYLNNIYLNFTFIMNSMGNSQDEKGNANVFQFLTEICNGLNKALGGINNLEPVIDEDTNSLKIIDTTPIPGITVASKVEDIILFGYDDVRSNFVRKLNIKTTIPPAMATMISVGATSGGYVKGVEATAFSRWNDGITDRYKPEFISPNVTSSIDAGKEIEEVYLKDFLSNEARVYGLDSLTEPRTFTDSDIVKNLTTATEFYRYTLSQSKKSSGTLGFIPFKLSFTMDGISGFKIYNKILLNLKFLSKDYQGFLSFLVTEISHNLKDNDWETEITVTLYPESDVSTLVPKSVTLVQNTARTAPTFLPSSGGGGLSANKGLSDVLISAGYTEGSFAYELALAIGTNEGYKEGSTNRPTRNNNPGNLDGDNFKDIDPGVTLESPNSKGEQRFAKFTTPELGAKALVEKKIKKWANGSYPSTLLNSKDSYTLTETSQTSYGVKTFAEYRKKYGVPNSLVGIQGKNIKLSLEQFMYIYAPPSGNNTEKYITSLVDTLKKKYPSFTRFEPLIDWIDK